MFEDCTSAEAEFAAKTDEEPVPMSIVLSQSATNSKDTQVRHMAHASSRLSDLSAPTSGCPSTRASARSAPLSSLNRPPLSTARVPTLLPTADPRAT